jgi:CheY-like chemotaxis protein
MKKILIVDDEPICLKLIKTLLTNNYQCDVDIVESAAEALHCIYEMAMEWKPNWYDLILMDINLPVLNGDVVTKIIKESETRMQHIPVIAITVDATAAVEKEKFLELGITDVVIKPITNEKLAVIMKKYLNI